MIDQDHELERTLDMSKLLRMCRPAIEDQNQFALNWLSTTLTVL